jgi:hypothetical protein
MSLEKAFSNGKWAITVHTVGELIDELSRLPRDLPVDQEYEGRGSDLVVINRDSDAHIRLDEAGFWDDES